jgi:hypothetical protein
MAFFGKILEKLGIRHASAAQPQSAPAQGSGGAPGASAASGAQPPGAAGAGGATTPAQPSPRAAAPQAMPMVDVVAQLEQRASANPQKLNWRTSIVDLLKLLDLDSSLDARKELATELGCPPDLMKDSAQMNMWLHKTVLARIAANGGNVPADLLH